MPVTVRGFNGFFCCVCKYSKLTRLIPVFAGAGELAAPEVAIPDVRWHGSTAYRPRPASGHLYMHR